jgi:hypothetical protein
MTITLDLLPEVEAKIKTQALNDGLTLEDYVKSLIEEAAQRRDFTKKDSQKTFREILEPVHLHFEESEMTEEEVLQLFEKARDDVWNEKQSSE